MVGSNRGSYTIRSDVTMIHSVLDSLMVSTVRIGHACGEWVMHDSFGCWCLYLGNMLVWIFFLTKDKTIALFVNFGFPCHSLFQYPNFPSAAARPLPRRSSRGRRRRLF